MIYKLAEDSWDSREIEAMNSVIVSGKYTMGDKVFEFERACARKFQAKNCIMVNSGSSANLIMLTALKFLYGTGWPTRPEIIVPAVSWSTTYNPFYYLGIVPVYVDVDPKTFCIDVEKASDAITENTVGILAVNILGQASKLLALEELCKNREIVLLEDNCESLGAIHAGRLTGSFGIASSHSGFYSHHISTMEGGWILTESDEFADICRSLRAHGWIRELRSSWSQQFRSSDETADRFKFISPGLNFRPLEFQGAVGLVQLEKFDEMLELRKSNAHLFVEQLSTIRDVDIQDCDSGASWFAFALILGDGFKISRSDLFKKLAGAEIEARPLIAGNFTRHPVAAALGGRVSGELTVSDIIHERGLYVGNHPKDLSKEIVGFSNFLKDLCTIGN